MVLCAVHSVRVRCLVTGYVRRILSNGAEGMVCRGGKSALSCIAGEIRLNVGVGVLVGDAASAALSRGALVVNNGAEGAGRVEGPQALLTVTDCYMGHRSSSLLYQVTRRNHKP